MEKQTFEQVVLRYDGATCTGRVYPRRVLENACEDYRRRIAEGRALGPVRDGAIVLRNVAFRVTSMSLEDSGLKATIEFLQNECGKRLARELIEGEAVLTTSGVGTVRDNQVGDDYVLVGLSIVPKEDV